MPIFSKLKDDQYEVGGTKHTRKIARAILIDQDNKVCLHSIHRDDAFGNQYYFETPGGGVDEGESFKQALKREIREEVGCEIEIIEFLGQVIDFYNKINRKNINHFFLAKVKSFSSKHFVSEGDLFIQDTKFYEINEAIRLMETQEDFGVSLLVKNRELPFLKLVKNKLK